MLLRLFLQIMTCLYSKRLVTAMVGPVFLCLTTCQQVRVQASSHWCEHPVEQLRWLSDLIDNVRSYAARGGWEMHQARYERQEVFVLGVADTFGVYPPRRGC